MNHPAHYNAHPSGVECIEVVEHFNFNIGNALKYLWRAGLKGDAIEDLRKAAWYALREASRLGWRGEATPKQAVLEEPSTRATRVFFYIDVEGSLRIIPFDAMPFDPGDLNPNAGALFIRGTAFARTEGCARAAERNTQLYSDATRAAFAKLASKIEEWRVELLHTGTYVQIQPKKS